MTSSKKSRLSERDLELLSALESAPNSSAKELSATTPSKIPPSTVAKRLKKLKERGVITTCINRAVLEREFPVRSIMSIKLDTTKLKSKHYSDQQQFAEYLKKGPWNVGGEFKKFASLVLVHHVSILLGGEQGDIMVEISARTTHDLMEFLTKCVQLCPGVMHTNTATVGFAV